MSSSTNDIIPIIQSYLATQPVEKAWLFGSYARGEETAESDVDILVRYSSDLQPSLYKISSIICGLSRRLSRKVDIVEDGCLLPFAIDSVDSEKILIYERGH